MNPPSDDNAIPCPKCGGPIRWTGALHKAFPPTVDGLTVKVTIDPFDLRRHAACLGGGGPKGGQPLPVPFAA